MDNSFFNDFKLEPKLRDNCKKKDMENSKDVSYLNLPRTDMAAELVGKKCFDTNFLGITKNKVRVDKQLSEKINKPQGTYITLESLCVKLGQTDNYAKLSKAISKAILELAENIDKIKNVLVVCLGNPNLTADALGAKIFDNLIITRHLANFDNCLVSVSALCPNVMGATGIESFDIIKGVVDKIQPQLVIAVDSLASAAVSRIASAFQLCSSGITPGSGVSNHRMRLDKSSLGVPVLSIGVPLVVYATTIIAEASSIQSYQELNEDIKNLIVTPKDIDLLVEECAKIIAGGINNCFNKGWS